MPRALETWSSLNIRTREGYLRIMERVFQMLHEKNPHAYPIPVPPRRPKAVAFSNVKGLPPTEEDDDEDAFQHINRKAVAGSIISYTDNKQAQDLTAKPPKLHL